MSWHTDSCHRFSVVVRGEALRIEYRGSLEAVELEVAPGMAGWDAPDPQVHRGVNCGRKPYEEIVTFYLNRPGEDPQPVAT